MPMMVGQIHTKDSLAAVNRIKSAIRKERLEFSFDIPKEFLSKREYMQNDKFLKNNSKVMDIGEQIGIQNEKIRELFKKRREVDIDDFLIDLFQWMNNYSELTASLFRECYTNI